MVTISSIDFLIGVTPKKNPPDESGGSSHASGVLSEAPALKRVGILMSFPLPLCHSRSPSVIPAEAGIQYFQWFAPYLDSPVEPENNSEQTFSGVTLNRKRQQQVEIWGNA